MSGTLDNLLYKYRAHFSHAKQVKNLSMIIFDKTKEIGIHNLSDKRRKLLKYGSCLHDIGYYIDAKGHNKHSSSLIKKEDFDGKFTIEQKDIIACIARYHRGNLPQKNHTTYSSLEKKEQKMVQKLSGIVKLADGLDREHIELVKDIEFKYNEKHNILWARVIPKSPDFKLDLFWATRKKELFEKAFEVQLVLVSG